MAAKPASVVAADDATEARLAQVLTDAMDAAGRGEPFDLEALCREHSDLAADLRQLLPTVLVVDAMADFSASAAGTVTSSSINVVSRPFGSAASGSTSLGLPSGFGPTSTDLRRPSLPPRIRRALGQSPTIGELPRRLGDYVLLDELGHGGMGVVYRAKQISLDRIVALKMIRDERLDADDERTRFEGEAQSAARLDHPHIVPIYDVGEIDGRAYFSMRLIEGTTLADRLRMVRCRRAWRLRF